MRDLGIIKKSFNICIRKWGSELKLKGGMGGGVAAELLLLSYDS